MTRIALAGASDLVTRAGTVVAGEGGSVVEVAVAASLTAMCIDPGVCAPLGGGYLTIDLPGRDPVVIDGYMAFPGLGFSGESFTRTVTMEYGGGVTTLVDAGSVAVPGAFAAFEMANSRYGVVPWKLIMDVVAEIVEPGFPLLSTAVIYLTEGANQIFDQDPLDSARGWCPRVMETYEFYQSILRDYPELHGKTPRRIAIDLHGDRFVRERRAFHGLPLDVNNILTTDVAPVPRRREKT